MANKRTQMRKVRELLRLNFEQNISARQAAKILGIGKTAASQYISGFKASGLSISNVETMTDSELLNVINLKKESENLPYRALFNQFTYFEKEPAQTSSRYVRKVPRNQPLLIQFTLSHKPRSG